jgi:hypothetical protein
MPRFACKYRGARRTLPERVVRGMLVGRGSGRRQCAARERYASVRDCNTMRGAPWLARSVRAWVARYLFRGSTRSLLAEYADRVIHCQSSIRRLDNGEGGRSTRPSAPTNASSSILLGRLTGLHRRCPDTCSHHRSARLRTRLRRRCTRWHYRHQLPGIS